MRLGRSGLRLPGDKSSNATSAESSGTESSSPAGGAWGDQGYIRLVRGIENASGQCGIAMQASYPVKTTPNPPPSPPKPPGPPPPPKPQPNVCDTSTECPNGEYPTMRLQYICEQKDLSNYCLPKPQPNISDSSTNDPVVNGAS